MSLVEKVQKKSLETRKALLWIVVIVIAVAFSFWRVGVFHSRINQLKESSELAPLQYQSSDMEVIKNQFDDIKMFLNQSKEVNELIKNSGIDTLENILLVQEYILQNSANPEEDLKRAEEDENFFNSMLNQARENN